MNIIALSIPAFFVLIGVELLVSRLRRRQIYRFNDAVTDLSCGITSQLFGSVLLHGFIIGVYVWIFTVFHEDGVGLGKGLLVWIAAAIAIDFIYYWWHRLSHEINILWAAHIVHHHSEDYNLAVALRQAWFTGLTAMPLYWPLAILGVPPFVYGVCKSINTLYQFWIHTELVGKTRWFGLLFNTPSHHRVHHAINEHYLDRNYAGILIIWDKMFGSFEPEGDECVYGTTKPINSFNPIWANFHHFRDMYRKSRTMPRWRDKIGVWFRHPGWSPDGHAPGLSAEILRERKADKYNPDARAWVKVYVAVQFLAVTAGTVALLLYVKQLTPAVYVTAVVLLMVTTLVWGGLFEGRRWAWPLEAARVTAAGAFIYAAVWPATLVT